MPGELDIKHELEGLGILITGATGFIGKALIEKLLRSIPEVKQLYLLVRRKKGISPEDRIDKMFDIEFYDLLREQNPNFKNKLTVIQGDCSLPGLGISEQDRFLLIREVNIIFHSAAIVKFEDKLRATFLTNVVGTRELLELGKEAKHLKGFVHLSTAYAQCHRPSIEGKFYDAPLDPAKLDAIVTSLDDNILRDIGKTITSPLPNTYSYCKAVAEHLIRDYSEYFPVAIIRPPNILGTAEEPVKGWTNNIYGPTGFIVGSGCGVLRVAYGDDNQKVDLVPADYTINCLIAMAAKMVKTKESDVYNFTAKHNVLQWKEFRKKCTKAGLEIPPSQSMWCIMNIMTSRWWLYKIYFYLFQYLPGLIIDFFAIITRAKIPRLTKIYMKYDKLSTIGAFFQIRSWEFDTTSVVNLWNSLTAESQKIFYFDLESLDWDNYMVTYVRGLRKYILKDDLSTVEAAKKRYKMFVIANKILVFCLASMSIVLLYYFFVWVMG